MGGVGCRGVQGCPDIPPTSQAARMLCASASPPTGPERHGGPDVGTPLVQGRAPLVSGSPYLPQSPPNREVPVHL